MLAHRTVPAVPMPSATAYLVVRLTDLLVEEDITFDEACAVVARECHITPPTDLRAAVEVQLADEGYVLDADGTAVEDAGECWIAPARVA